jgi:hypothetical protein
VPGHRSAESGGTSTITPSDLDNVRAWWRTLGGEGFVTLPPPTRNRYTQSDGHHDAAELFAARGLDSGTSYAYWQWQSHQAFDRSGALIRELMLHWGGDHAVVAAGLGSGPAGYQIADGGPQGAFRLDRITQRDGSGMPDHEDPAAVRQFLDDLDEPSDHSRLPYHYRPLTGTESDWLHDRLRDPVDLSISARFVTSLERRDALTYEEASRLLPAWRECYAGRLTKWRGWRSLLRALLRHDHDQVWNAVESVGAEAADVLGEVPSERGLTVVRDMALGGDSSAVAAWLKVHQAIHQPGWVPAAASLAAELIEHGTQDGPMHALSAALRIAVVKQRRQDSGAVHRADVSLGALTSVQLSTDERLPRRLRAVAGDAAREHVARLREEATRHGPAYAGFTGTTAEDALAAADRFEAVRDELLAGTGPELAAYEGTLVEVWHRYRTLTDADVGWLRTQVADDRTQLQGLGFCLELLYAHGAATEADVDALVPRWKRDLTKKYRTTYTEWRHPLVTLTCLALDLGHPVAADLLAWWAKPKPLWKNSLRLLTHLGAPDEAKAAELWEFIASRAHDTGHLMTWVLLRARLDQVPPLLVADRLVRESDLPKHALQRVLIGVADPAQPLWHFNIDPLGWAWWHRAVEVADHPELSAAARAAGLEVARKHHLIRYPDNISPAPTSAELTTAQTWIDQHNGA